MCCNRTVLGKPIFSVLSLILITAAGTITFAEVSPVRKATSFSNGVRLPAVISDNMVLQQGRAVPIWGWAEPNEQIMFSVSPVRKLISNGVSWHTARWGITANKDGKWTFKMNPPSPGGPYEMTISGKNTITIKNILVGEVWVCSGQSNMQMAVSQSANSQQEIAEAGYPNIRLFYVERKVADQPQSDCNGLWVQCSPQTVGNFSAAAYFFGRELHQQLNIPVGLIHTSWGGTPAEAWTSARVLKTLPDYKDVMEEMEQVRVNLQPFQERYQKQLLEWQKKIDLSDSSTPLEKRLSILTG